MINNYAGVLIAEAIDRQTTALNRIADALFKLANPPASTDTSFLDSIIFGTPDDPLKGR